MRVSCPLCQAPSWRLYLPWSTHAWLGPPESKDHRPVLQMRKLRPEDRIGAGWPRSEPSRRGSPSLSGGVARCRDRRGRVREMPEPCFSPRPTGGTGGSAARHSKAQHPVPRRKARDSGREGGSQLGFVVHQLQTRGLSRCPWVGGGGRRGRKEAVAPCSGHDPRQGIYYGLSVAPRVGSLVPSVVMWQGSGTLGGGLVQGHRSWGNLPWEGINEDPRDPVIGLL